MWEETARLRAMGDSGTIYDVVEFTYVGDHSQTSAETRSVASTRSYALLDGTVLAVEADGTLVHFETDEVLKII